MDFLLERSISYSVSMNHLAASCRVSTTKPPLPCLPGLGWEGIKGRVKRDFATPTKTPPNQAGQARGRDFRVTL
jgi:hypothetical protein